MQKRPDDDEAARRLVDMGLFANKDSRPLVASLDGVFDRARKLDRAHGRVAVTVDTAHGRRRLYTFEILNPG